MRDNVMIINCSIICFSKTTKISCRILSFCAPGLNLENPPVKTVHKTSNNLQVVSHQVQDYAH